MVHLNPQFWPHPSILGLDGSAMQAADLPNAQSVLDGTSDDTDNAVNLYQRKVTCVGC